MRYSSTAPLFFVAICLSGAIIHAQNPDDPFPQAQTPPPPTLDQSADAQEDEEKSMMEEWEKHMSDFNPADLITFAVQAKSVEIVFEDITALPSRVRGAYFVSSGKGQEIDFTIIDQNKKVVFRKMSQKEGIFYFDAPIVGQYSFIFDNRKGGEAKDITLALHCGNSSDEFVKKQELSPVEESIANASQFLNEIRTETLFAYKRQETYYMTTEGNHNQILLYSILETLVLIATTVWQIYYIKRILDNRMIV